MPRGRNRPEEKVKREMEKRHPPKRDPTLPLPVRVPKPQKVITKPTTEEQKSHLRDETAKLERLKMPKPKKDKVK